MLTEKTGKMINIFRKKVPLSEVMYGLTDCHSHIQPGVDDGIQTECESCEVLSNFETQGVQKMILTPHIMEEYPFNTASLLSEKFNTLRNAYHGNIELVLGAEYMLDGAFEKLLDKNEIIKIFDNHILIETSYMHCPVNFHQQIKKIQSKGYHVILAHPERYLYMEDEDYKSLKNKGVKFQLNILSLVGVYGKQAQKKSEKLLAKDYYNCIGSDIHNLANFQKHLTSRTISVKIAKKIKTLNEGL